MFNHNMVQQWQTLKFYSSMFNHNMVLTWFNLWQTAIIARNIKPKGPLGACAAHVFSPQTMFATNIMCDCDTCIYFIDTYSSKLYSLTVIFCVHHCAISPQLWHPNQLWQSTLTPVISKSLFSSENSTKSFFFTWKSDEITWNTHICTIFSSVHRQLHRFWKAVLLRLKSIWIIFFLLWQP